MIEIHQQAIPGTCTRRGSLWRATALVDGQMFEAASRSGAPNELARVLVAAGIPDQPVRISHEGLRGHYSTGSLHEMAGWTYHDAQKVRYRPKQGGESDEDGSEPVEPDLDP